MVNPLKLNPIDKKRFLNKINYKNISSCWLWTAAKDENGYGLFALNKIMKSTHRIAWTNWIGEIPIKMCVCHTCDTPACIRPDHLFLGTHKQNMEDKVAKRRHERHKQTHCKNGHALSGNNLAKWGLKLNKRKCVICHNKKTRRARLKARNK